MCTQTVTHSRVKVDEGQRKAVFRNQARQEYEVSTVDGCLVTDGIRCDRLVSRCDDVSVLIELKGSGVDHACDQLFGAVRHENVRPLLKDRVGFLVICRKFPRFDTAVRKAKEKAAREFKAGFHVVCNRGEFDIARVVEIDGPY